MRPLPTDFDPELYLTLNADVARAVETGEFASAEAHYQAYGVFEHRRYRPPPPGTGPVSSLFGSHVFRYSFGKFGPMPEYAFEAPSVAEDDEEVCARVIAAWHRAIAQDRSAPRGMWRARMDGHDDFYQALERRDAAALAPIMAGMFQSHLTHGLAMGQGAAETARYCGPDYAAAWSDRLLRLAEATGLMTVRSPEQGDVYMSLECRLDLVPAIEAELGFPLAVPPVGAPYGVRLHGSCFPELSFSHAYLAWRAHAHVPAGADIAELGGGFGGLCWFLHRHAGRYTIFDLPFANTVQGYFLIKAGLDVSLFGEEERAVRVLPWWELDRRAGFDLLVNQDSIPEMPPEVGEAYIARIKHAARLFLSVNQEAAALHHDGLQQLVVPDLVRREGGYRRISRDPFWLREGYVQELYESQAHDG